MNKRHDRLGRFVAAMMTGIAAVFITTAQAQSGTPDVSPTQPVGEWIEHGSRLANGEWIEHGSQLAEGGCYTDDDGIERCYGEDGELIGNASQPGGAAIRMYAAPQGSGGLRCDSQGNCRVIGQLIKEDETMFAAISLQPPEAEPLCDTDPFSCFYLVNKDTTIPDGMRNIQQAFKE